MQNMFRGNKERLKEYQKNYRQAKKLTSKNVSFFLYTL